MGTKEVVLYELCVARGESAYDLLEAVSNSLDRTKGNLVRVEIYGVIDEDPKR